MGLKSPQLNFLLVTFIGCFCGTMDAQTFTWGSHRVMGMSDSIRFHASVNIVHQ